MSDHASNGRVSMLTFKVKTKLSSPSGKKLKKRKSTAEPTMTFHTRAATNELYDMFSAPFKSSTEEHEEDEESEVESNAGDSEEFMDEVSMWYNSAPSNPVE